MPESPTLASFDPPSMLAPPPAPALPAEPAAPAVPVPLPAVPAAPPPAPAVPPPLLVVEVELLVEVDPAAPVDAPPPAPAVLPVVDPAALVDGLDESSEPHATTKHVAKAIEANRMGETIGAALAHVTRGGSPAGAAMSGIGARISRA
jgi:hypothetical protein